MPIYACVDNLTLLDVPTEYEIPTQDELAIGGHSYRRLDPVYMAWITQRITTAQNDARIEQQRKSELQDFLNQCNATGVKPEAIALIPKGYSKPNIAEELDWVTKLDWDEAHIQPSHTGAV